MIATPGPPVRASSTTGSCGTSRWKVSLRVSTFFGFAVSFVAFIYLVITVVQVIVFGSEADGWPSLMAVTLFLGGVQLLALGVIGEYVGRIFQETKGRPVYLVGESNVAPPVAMSGEARAQP